MVGLNHPVSTDNTLTRYMLKVNSNLLNDDIIISVSLFNYCLFTHPPPLGGADAYMFYRCFFSVRHNDSAQIWDNRSRERLNGFSWNFYQTIAGKM